MVLLREINCIVHSESDPTIEDSEERLPNEIDNEESEDSDFELDSNESESDGESSEVENDSKAATSNKENEPIIEPNKGQNKSESRSTISANFVKFKSEY